MRQFNLRRLTSEVRVTLKEMYRNAPKTRLRQRAHMVLLAEKGFRLKTISNIVDVRYNSVCRYVHTFAPKGFLALYDATKPGRRSQLTQQQLTQVDKWLELSPRELHYQQSCWTMKLMTHRIKAVYQVTLTSERVRQIVHELGFTLVRPRHQSRLANPEQVQKADEEIKELQDKAERGEIVLFYQDEAKLSRFPTITRMWVKKGTQHQIPTDNDHETFWVYGVSNPKTGKVHYRIQPSLNGECFRRFLIQLRRCYPNRQITLIVDRSSAHQAKIVKEYLKEDLLMELYQLPPYSPKLNKIERIWKWMRRRVTHIHLFSSIPELKEAVRNFFRYLNRVPKKVMRCMAAT